MPRSPRGSEEFDIPVWLHRELSINAENGKSGIRSSSRNQSLMNMNTLESHLNTPIGSRHVSGPMSPKPRPLTPISNYARRRSTTCRALGLNPIQIIPYSRRCSIRHAYLSLN